MSTWRKRSSKTKRNGECVDSRLQREEASRMDIITSLIARRVGRRAFDVTNEERRGGLQLIANDEEEGVRRDGASSGSSGILEESHSPLSQLHPGRYISCLLRAGSGTPCVTTLSLLKSTGLRIQPSNP